MPLRRPLTIPTPAQTLAHHGEHDVGVDVRYAVLDAAFARALAEQAAVGKRLHHFVDLVVTAFAIHELIEPPAHVWQQGVEQHAAAAREAQTEADPQQVDAADEQLDHE